MKKTVVIAGASGFIGRWFIERFQETYHIIALSRREVTPDEGSSVTWRTVDLYSLGSTTQALEGAGLCPLSRALHVPLHEIESRIV